MAKAPPPKWPWTAAQIKKGRGAGVGKDYVPWFHVRDVSSTGKSTRFKSWKSGRTIQNLSDLETGFALLMDWTDPVVDYYEQFPLLPLDETLELGAVIGYVHPIDRKTDEPRVRTTDFLVIGSDAGPSHRTAVAIKPASKLASKTVLLSLEVERRYWAEHRADWAIVTEHELPKIAIENIDWIHDARDLTDHEAIAALPLVDILPELQRQLLNDHASLATACLAVDRRVGMALGASLFLFRHQLANKRWTVDMNTKIDPQRPIELLTPLTDAQVRKGAA